MTAAVAVNEQLLPPQLRRIVRAIGLPAALALLTARGGTRLWLPKRAAVSRVLNEILGAEAARKLVDEFRGEKELTVPKADKITAQIRDRTIVAERAAGMSVAKLALRYRLTRRHIQNLVRQAEAHARQGELFAKAG